jgi:RNA polymerase sigma-70 factor, ECF subfamily
MTVEANKAIERIARLSYGKLVALLASRTGSFPAADDALAEALKRALEKWPIQGVPPNPEGWLVTTAKRHFLDSKRAAGVGAKAQSHLQLLMDERADSDVDLKDERLKLLFVCAHPAIAERDRTPLMLQTVLGLDARRIASAFLTSPGTMGQCLVRAKAKIEQANIPFSIPDADSLHERLDSVLSAIYAAYTLGWDNAYSDDLKSNTMSEEAIWLGSLLSQLLPLEPEALGLTSLMLFCQSRRNARRDTAGNYISLLDQDQSLWDHGMIRDAEAMLRSAGRLKTPGRYQLEAAIQAVHSARSSAAKTDWGVIALLYEGLTAISPTVGALTAAASAIAQAHGLSAGLVALNKVPEEFRKTYQPWWAVRAHLLAGLGDSDGAAACYLKAAGLTEDRAVREFLLAKSAEAMQAQERFS